MWFVENQSPASYRANFAYLCRQPTNQLCDTGARAHRQQRKAARQGATRGVILLVAVSRDVAFLKRLGANLRRVRNQRGMTQECLAELANLTTRNVQKLEAGQFTPLVTTVKRVRDALKCEWDELVGR